MTLFRCRLRRSRHCYGVVSSRRCSSDAVMASSHSSNAIQAPSYACKRHRLSVITGVQKMPLSGHFLDVIQAPFHADEKRNLHALFQAFQTPFEGSSHAGEKCCFSVVSEMDASLGIVKVSFRCRFDAATGVLSPAPPKHQLEDD